MEIWIKYIFFVFFIWNIETPVNITNNLYNQIWRVNYSCIYRRGRNSEKSVNSWTVSQLNICVLQDVVYIRMVTGDPQWLNTHPRFRGASTIYVYSLSFSLSLSIYIYTHVYLSNPLRHFPLVNRTLWISISSLAAALVVAGFYHRHCSRSCCLLPLECFTGFTHCPENSWVGLVSVT